MSISSRDRAGGNGLRLYSHNIWGRQGDWPARRRVLIDGLRELDPDLITFQETIVLEGYDQVADLLGEGYHVVHSRERAPDGIGTSIASRWPIIDVHDPDLHVTPRAGSYPCSSVIAEIEAPHPFGPLLLLNHFPEPHVDHELERELQTVLIARHIEERIAQRPAHVLVSGDINAEPDAACVRFLTGKQSLDGMSVCYRSAWESVNVDAPGDTFTPLNPLVRQEHPDWPYRRIDHILVRCGERGDPTLRIAGCELAFAEPVGEVWGSDHFGLVADIAPWANGGSRQAGTLRDGSVDWSTRHVPAS